MDNLLVVNQYHHQMQISNQDHRIVLKHMQQDHQLNILISVAHLDKDQERVRGQHLLEQATYLYVIQGARDIKEQSQNYGSIMLC